MPKQIKLHHYPALYQLDNRPKSRMQFGTQYSYPVRSAKVGYG